MAGSKGHGGPDRRPPSVLFLNWRDCRNPEAGGSEIYVETIARALAAGGSSVTLQAAAFPGAPAQEWVEGVLIRRRGTKISVYPRALRDLRSGALGRPDVIVDVQNGVPFSSPLARRAPTAVLVHHVHREQWPVVYGPARARLGWWLESRVGPWVYRRSRYVTVSAATQTELASLGIDPERITVVHNGIEPPTGTHVHPSDSPRILVLGRIVPHKQVEHVLRAAARLRPELPSLRVSVVGDGWWRDQVVAEAQRIGVHDIVEFHGFVDDAEKQTELARAWVLAMPSVKEGWGLAISEAGARGVPSVAYREAGGTAESIADGRSGLLAASEEELTGALRRILTDAQLRTRLGEGARQRAQTYTWQAASDRFAHILSTISGRPIRAGTVTWPALLGSVAPTTEERSRSAS